tara:strand:+ start:226 stop:612 length:387 start_codon:yes stop_codon:yes gene_type:complete
MKSELMVQQQVKSVWQHMVGVICLNLTDRVQVKRVLPKLFKKYPTPIKFIKGNSNTQKKMLQSLGMVNIRWKRLRQMSIDFLTWDYKDATDLYGIGKYGSDSYRIFYLNDIPKDVTDKELRRYINESA